MTTTTVTPAVIMMTGLMTTIRTIRDPVFVFARASQVAADLEIQDVTGGALRRILNDDALDTYIDRGELYAFADAMGDVEMMRRDLDGRHL